MSDSQQQPWSDDPNAPKIPYSVYYLEKVVFAGNFATSILYGVTIILFFRCIAALFNPVHRRGEPIKWGLVSYTVVMFSLVTIGTAMQLDLESISYIDNREFRSFRNGIPPGPAGYDAIIQSNAIVIIQNIAFALNNWLADGFLLYRCYVIYSMNLWVIAFPCLMYLGSLAMGIAFVYQTIRVLVDISSLWSTLPYLSISLSLNILLTLMIVIRLILRARDTRTTLGMTGIGGLCKAIVVMLVESCTLYAVNSVLVIGPLGATNQISGFFLSTIGEIQVIAPLFIILRVVNKSALTNNTTASGRINDFKTRIQEESTGGGGVPPSGGPVSSVDGRGMNSGSLGVEIQTMDIDSNQVEI